MQFSDLFKDYSTPGVLNQDLQARINKQEMRNLTLHEAQPLKSFNHTKSETETVIFSTFMYKNTACCCSFYVGWWCLRNYPFNFLKRQQYKLLHSTIILVVH